MSPTCRPAGQQVIEDQRRRLAELKQKAAAEAQCQWDALRGVAPCAPLLHHSILHHLQAGRERGAEAEHAYDTLSLESSDSMDTSVSTGGNSACSPDNASRYRPARPAPGSLLARPRRLQTPLPLPSPVPAAWTWPRSRRWRRCCGTLTRRRAGSRSPG